MLFRSSPLLRGGSFRNVGIKTPALQIQPQRSHLLIDAAPQRVKRAKRWERQHELASGMQMRNEALRDFKTMRTEEHHRQIAGNAIIAGKIRRQCAHIHAAKLQPGKLSTLNRSRPRHLAGAQINAKHLATRTNLLGYVERGNPMASRYIENRGPGKQIEMPQ